MSVAKTTLHSAVEVRGVWRANLLLFVAGKARAAGIPINTDRVVNLCRKLILIRVVTGKHSTEWIRLSDTRTCFVDDDTP